MILGKNTKKNGDFNLCKIRLCTYNQKKIFHSIGFQEACQFLEKIGEICEIGKNGQMFPYIA
jgi:hypothetical protein